METLSLGLPGLPLIPAVLLAVQRSAAAAAGVFVITGIFLPFFLLLLEMFYRRMRTPPRRGRQSSPLVKRSDLEGPEALLCVGL